MADLEEVFSELNRFESGRQVEIPGQLELYLKHVAHTGDSVFPWPKVRPLLKRKLDLVADQYCQHSPPEKIPAMPNVDPFKYDQLKQEIHSRIDCLSGTPFTIQRLCELLTEPQRFYKRIDKFMRGVEKNVLVVTTIEATRTRRPLEAEVVNGAAAPPLWGPLEAASTSGSSPQKSVSGPAPPQTAEACAMETSSVTEVSEQRPRPPPSQPETTPPPEAVNGETPMEVEAAPSADSPVDVTSAPAAPQTSTDSPKPAAEPPAPPTAASEPPAESSDRADTAPEPRSVAAAPPPAAETAASESSAVVVESPAAPAARSYAADSSLPSTKAEEAAAGAASSEQSPTPPPTVDAAPKPVAPSAEQAAPAAAQPQSQGAPVSEDRTAEEVGDAPVARTEDHGASQPETLSVSAAAASDCSQPTPAAADAEGAGEQEAAAVSPGPELRATPTADCAVAEGSAASAATSGATAAASSGATESPSPEEPDSKSSRAPADPVLDAEVSQPSGDVPDSTSGTPCVTPNVSQSEGTGEATDQALEAPPA